VHGFFTLNDDAPALSCNRILWSCYRRLSETIGASVFGGKEPIQTSCQHAISKVFQHPTTRRNQIDPIQIR